MFCGYHVVICLCVGCFIVGLLLVVWWFWIFCFGVWCVMWHVCVIVSRDISFTIEITPMACFCILELVFFLFVCGVGVLYCSCLLLLVVFCLVSGVVVLLY